MATPERPRRAVRSNLKRRVAAVLGPPSDRVLVGQLLTEMQHVFLDSASTIGATPSEIRRAVKLAQANRKRARPSQATLQLIHALSALLACWRQDKRYCFADGTPRVLAITGKGATFETLARKFVPGVALTRVLKLICENAEVMRVAGNKLVLHGSPVLIEPKTPEILLASLVLRFRRLAETTLHNAAIPAHVRGTGRFERVVTGELSEKAFERFSRGVRQRLQDTCDHVDAGMPQPSGLRRTRTKRKTCGIGIYVFKDDGDIG
jgi:hypothetical protein